MNNSSQKIYLVAGKAFIMIVYISCDTVIVSVDTECDTAQSAVKTVWVAPSSTNGLSNSVKIGGVVLVTGVSESDILALCPDAPSGAIILNFGVWCYVADVITQAEFCVLVQWRRDNRRLSHWQLGHMTAVMFQPQHRWPLLTLVSPTLPSTTSSVSSWHGVKQHGGLYGLCVEYCDPQYQNHNVYVSAGRWLSMGIV